MVNLRRCELNFDKTFDYVNDNLNETNTLSTELINLIDWKSGKFFAFLPINVKIENIHFFEYGDIAVNRCKIKAFILNEIKKNNQLTCIFDDFSDEYKPGDTDPFFLDYGLFYQKELYFFLTKKTASPQSIKDCFFVSNAIWHSLCVLSRVDLVNKKDKELTLPEIRNICLNTTLVVVGAYDAEGYVLWESSENKHSSVTELNDDEIKD